MSKRSSILFVLGIFLSYVTITNAQTRLRGVTSASGGSGAPTDAQYWVGAANGTLTAEKNLGVLATAFVINTAGVPSAYAGSTPCGAGDFVSAISAVGVATCGTPSGGMSIGGTVTAGTATRVLFVGAGPVLAEDADLTFSIDTLTSTGLIV